MTRALNALLLIALCSFGAFAELSVGTFYRVKNASGNYLTDIVGSTPKSSASGAAENSVWTLESTGTTGVYYFKSFASDQYLTSNGGSSWFMSDDTTADASKLNVVFDSDNSNYYVYYASHSTGCAMHQQGGTYNIVGWGYTATNSRWTFEEVSDDEIATFNEIKSLKNNCETYQTYLDALFSDKACTALSVSGDLSSNSNYTALPLALQQMVDKVNADSWDEDNADSTKEKWDAEYARKYRVQLIEPYNEPERAASALGINAHTNLNNPTGIYADTYDIIYIMVDGEIADGAHLYLASYTGYGKLGGYADGIQLSEGLNIVPVYADNTNFCINYVVESFNTEYGKGSSAKNKQLSDFEPLKIHIEGGHINGFYNKVGDSLYSADTNEDWEYIEQRATQKAVTVLGKYMTLQFPLNDDDTEGNKGLAYYFNDQVNIEDVINEWDNIMLWQRMLMGVNHRDEIANVITSPVSGKPIFEYSGNDAEFGSDYSDFYNVHGLAYGVGGNTYMYGSWDHSGYHYNTMPSIITELPTGAGVHWSPGHEIGHQHQGPLNMRGLTETTNNLFSNMVLWCFGKSTSRFNGTQGALEQVLENFNTEGSDFFSMNIWAQTQMYYKLFLYYHVLGNDTKFYPRLFEMLRQDPMTIAYAQDGADCLLHFYKKCCQAAGQDLTEFFRAHGFFEVMTDRLVGDYSNAVYNMTQEQIDAAIQEVKQLGYDENIAVLFVNDGTGEQILSHRNDGTYLTLYDGVINAELGGYASFNDSGSPSYSYSFNGSTISLEGSGGIGFAICNDEGELLAFSDKKTFSITLECAELIMAGKAKLALIAADGSQTLLDFDISAQYALLGDLMAKTKAIIDLADESETKVGFFKPESLESLIAAYEKTNEVYEAKTDASFEAIYDALLLEYTKILADDNARIGIVQGNAYMLTNCAYPSLSMSINDSNVMLAETSDESADAQKWYLEASSTDGAYYLKNKGTETYPGNVATSVALSATATDTSSAYAYTLQDKGNGLWAFMGETGLHCASTLSYKIVGWGTDAPASQWYITAVEIDTEAEAQNNLAQLIAKTETLISEMTVPGFPISARQYTLQVTDPDAAGYLTCSNLYNPNNVTTNGDDVDYNCAHLLDGDVTTYIHTDYSADASTYPHYLTVDFGNAVPDQFKFSYTTRSQGANQVPKKIVVKGSNDNADYSAELAVFSSADDSNPLPTTTSAPWTSADFIASGYRYLRFEVQESAQGTAKPYFVMSEFAIICDAPLADKYADNCADQYLAAIEECELAAAATDLDAAYSSLKEKYDALLAARNAVDSAALSALKTELQTLIDETNALIETCAQVSYTPAMPDFKAALQTSDPDGDFYLWTNAQSSQEGPIANLIDGNTSTHFHTDYSGSNSSDGLDHHITVNFGSTTISSSIQFTFTNRSDANGNYPAEIVVYGSTDGTTFSDVLATLSDMEPGKSTVYLSPTIELSQNYAALRFMVTKNNTGNTKGGHQFFHMAEFSLMISGSEGQSSVTLTDDSGSATEEQVLNAYIETLDAATVITYATAESQVQDAYAELSEAYETLKAAQAFDRSALKALIAEVQTLLASCQDSWLNAVDQDFYNSEISAAQTAYDDKTISEEAYQTAIDELTATKAQLTDDIAYGPLPVKLTSDLTNPNYHFFVINRSADAVIQKGGITTDSRWPQDHKIRVTSRAVPADEQLWYFAKAETAPNVYVYNKAVAQDSIMSVISGDLAEGAGKVGFYNLDGSDGTPVCTQWLISNENSAEGFYNVRAASNTDYYFSNIYGTTNNLGFYNSNTSTDPGSNFKFEPKSETWLTLYNLFRDEVKITLDAPDFTFPTDMISESTAGCYRQALAAAYENAYSEAQQQILSSDATDEDLLSAANALKAANDALVANDGTSTSIEEITLESLNGATIYDLQGRRITNPRRLGIYIVNGLKTLLK